MTSIHARLAVVLAAMLTIGMAGRVGFACATYIYGEGSRGDYMACSYSGEDSNYCYYNCYCHDRANGWCDDIFALYGLETY